MNSLLGQQIGQYKVVIELGRGQHSVVYKAWQPTLERHVTLKVLHHYDQETLKKFQDEARLTAQLIQNGVPHIRQVYEVGQTPDGYLFVALQYVDDSLRSLLRRAGERRQRMSPSAAARLLEPIAQALDAIHSLGWVHLDIKPENILIAQGGRAILADFGIAQRRGRQTHACTPAYASPEQAAGDRPVGPWSDIYSLGVVLYEMVTGQPPVRGDRDVVLLNQHLTVMPPSPRQANPRLSPGQERAIYKALAKAPQERFRTAGEFLRALSAQEPSLSGLVKTPGKLLPTSARRSRGLPRWPVIGGLVALLLALLLLAWALWPAPPPAATTPLATSPVVTTASVLPPPKSPASATATARPAPPPTTATIRRPTVTLVVTPSRTSPATATTGIAP